MSDKPEDLPQSNEPSPDPSLDLTPDQTGLGLGDLPGGILVQNNDGSVEMIDLTTPIVNGEPNGVSSHAANPLASMVPVEMQSGPPAWEGNTTFAPYNPHRLCSDDHGCDHPLAAPATGGCRRTDTILALEAEFDTFVSPFMEWGVWDQFCVHEDSAFYYKPMLEYQITESVEAFSADEWSKHPVVVQLNQTDSTVSVVDRRGASSLEDVRKMLELAPAGFPKFQVETPHFYKFESFGTNKVTLDMIDRPLLDRIKSTFTDAVKPYWAESFDSLYDHDGKLYWSDLELWAAGPFFTKYFKGIFIMNKEPTEKYPSADKETYFFAFDGSAKLTPTEKEIIILLAQSHQRPLVFIDL